MHFSPSMCLLNPSCSFKPRALDADLGAVMKAGEPFDINRIPFVLEACLWKIQSVCNTHYKAQHVMGNTFKQIVYMTLTYYSYYSALPRRSRHLAYIPSYVLAICLKALFGTFVIWLAAHPQLGYIRIIVVPVSLSDSWQEHGRVCLQEPRPGQKRSLKEPRCGLQCMDWRLEVGSNAIWKWPNLAAWLCNIQHIQFLNQSDHGKHFKILY